MSQLNVALSILQTILCGMGELHIEIIHDRIRREYGIETHLGPLQVAYRETILHEVSTTGTTSTFLSRCVNLRVGDDILHLSQLFFTM